MNNGYYRPAKGDAKPSFVSVPNGVNMAILYYLTEHIKAMR